MPAQKRLALSKQSKSKGFTLIELLVVISIISILSIVGLTSFQTVRGKTTEAKRKADIDSIKNAYETKYDPSLFGGQGGYKPLSGSDFASTKIPTPDGTESTTYIAQGAYVTSSNPNPTPAPNFALAINLNTGSSCASIKEPGCYSTTSTQGIPVDTFTIGNSVLNGSFEIDSNNDGLADSWTTYRPGCITSTSLVSSPNPKDGAFVQKVVNGVGIYCGIAQTITGLKSSKPYTLTGWVYLDSQSNSYNCQSVGIGTQCTGGGETFNFCAMDQWVKLTRNCVSDASGNLGIDFQNWSPNANFYVDGVRVEEVK